MTRILVTGAAGFIGYHVAERLLARGDEVVGVDNMSPYYDVRLKEARLARLSARGGYRFVRGELSDRAFVAGLFSMERPEIVVHLAAQAGVRHSIDAPEAYIDSNLVGFANVLEGARKHPVSHLVYASSSSVYGANAKLPFSVGDRVDEPVSLYAATKKANELMAHAYAHLFAIPTTGLRFFTVYGPWGRPDMAYYKFTRAILAGHPIDVYNSGLLRRDFTYIDDIVEGVVRVMDRPPEALAGQSKPRLFNIGNSSPVELSEFISTLERTLGRIAVRRYLPMQPGDVPATFADIDELAALTGFRPVTSLEAGLKEFVRWYLEYHR